ncbi:MAG: pyridoxal phosphate-dependent aminotransferase [Clostridia bacterium]|nr:pyridoxal phosphate-dependent aminotransferase [Clostridia bacterium]
MKYNFDKPTDRRNTYSVKWDVGEGELPMWIADMDFETVPEVTAAIKVTAERGIFGYSTLPDEYFESVADFWEKRHGYRPDPSWMIYSSGIVAAISSIVRKLTAPAENVLIQAPVYNIFYNSILNNGRNVLSNDLVYENGEYRIDWDDLEAKLKNPQTSLMILCNPHNPVGKIWGRETLAKIGELCKQYGVTVVSDEIHCSLTAPGKNYVPFASVNDICADISVSCVAASKTFNLAGLQASCVIAKNPVLRHKVWRGINTDEVGEPNVFAVTATVAAYRHGGEWLDELREYLFENRRFATEILAKEAPKLYVVPAEASYLLWVDVSAYTDDSEAFAKDLREKTGLYVSDGAEYGHGGEKFVRINLATQRKNVEDGMRRLASYVASL